MKIKASGASRPWWRIHPELGIATGWTLVFGVLWLTARVLGVT
jgi:hypothetical protein